MEEYRDYDKHLPELVYDIVDYFRIGNNVKNINHKSVVDYCTYSRFNTLTPNKEIIQPDVVHLICENLVKKKILTCIRAGQGLAGINSNYLFLPQDDEIFLKKAPALVFKLNCMAYGFRYIYTVYRDYVMPIIVKKDGNVSMGTCFRFHSGIVTAKHCLDVDEVTIPGYTSTQLSQCPVLIGTDEDLDIAYIELKEPSNLLSGKAIILDEVLVMGYPKIPMFFDFCAAERAAISSIPTRGAVALLADQYITKNAGKLMLVTARIRGGNSGGPVIDSNGAVVGIAFSEPTSEGNYDEMGYGIAYPIDVFFQMLQNTKNLKVNFVDEIK